MYRKVTKAAIAMAQCSIERTFSAMKRFIIALLLCLVSLGWTEWAAAADCPASSYTLSSQAEVDAFPADCDRVIGDLQTENNAALTNLDKVSWLVVVIAFIGAASGFYYYFKIIRAIYWNESTKQSDIPLPLITKVAVILLTVALLVFGVYPLPLFNMIG